MGVNVGVLRTLTEEEFPDLTSETGGAAGLDWKQAPRWDPESFCREQIRALVKQVFFPGATEPSRQIVVSAVDPGVEIVPVCVQIAETLAEQMARDVCLVEANLRAPSLERIFGRNRSDGLTTQEEAAPVRESSRQICNRLWFAALKPPKGETEMALTWLKGQMAEKRRQFEYSIFHAPAASVYSETALLSHLADGLILVLQANATRRAVAQNTKEKLQAANARLLGTVLQERIFPIPERIYRRL